MEILIGLLIIAVGAFCQSSCYVPINKIKDWSWESYWIVQGVFAWLILPFIGAMLAVPSGHSFFELFDGYGFEVMMTMLFGMLWGVGGLTFGLSMRYLGVALGQSIALGTCAGLGTIMGPVLLNIFFPEMDALSSLTFSVILGVVVTLLGIAIIGVAGSMKASSLSDEEKKAAKKSMTEMLDYVNKLNELDTSDVEPMSHTFPVANVMREDVVTNGDDSENMLKNAPEKTENAYIVPQTF